MQNNYESTSETQPIKFITVRYNFLRFAEELIAQVASESRKDVCLRLTVENLMTEASAARLMNNL